MLMKCIRYISIYKLHVSRKYGDISRPHKKSYFSIWGIILIMSVSLVGCSGLWGSKTTEVNSSAQSVLLSELHWCNKSSNATFMDDAATAQNGGNLQLGLATGTPKAISWSMFKANLGFSIFLPAMLPNGSCLLKPFGWVRNGSSHNSFIITYLLPDQSSLTIAQTLQTASKTAFQCFVSPDPSNMKGTTPVVTPEKKQAPVQLCSGVRDSTNITFSARWAPKQMLQFFNSLQPDVNWTPVS